MEDQDLEFLLECCTAAMISDIGTISQTEITHDLRRAARWHNDLAEHDGLIMTTLFGCLGGLERVSPPAAAFINGTRTDGGLGESLLTMSGADGLELDAA